MNKTLTEFEEALLKADKALDEPYADPDDDLRTISRQFLRLNERYTQAKKEGAMKVMEKVKYGVPRFLKGGEIRNQYFVKGWNECRQSILDIK